MPTIDQKVKAVWDWGTPCSVSDLRSFLGLASYYRCYVHNFADNAAPLHQLTQKGTPFYSCPVSTGIRFAPSGLVHVFWA